MLCEVGLPPVFGSPATSLKDCFFVFCVFLFFWASLDELSSRDNKSPFAALGGVWLGATSEQRELGLAGVVH